MIFAVLTILWWTVTITTIPVWWPLENRIHQRQGIPFAGFKALDYTAGFA